MDELFVERYFRNDVRLETERTVLRKLCGGDLEDLFGYASDSDVTKFLPWESYKTKKEAASFLRSAVGAYRTGTYYDLAIELKATGRMIGTCGFTSFDFKNNCCEIGYVLSPKYRGYGLATEAAKKAVFEAFDTFRVHRVEARFIVGNNASFAVTQRLQMKYEGTLRGALFCKDRYFDVAVCSLTETDFLRYYRT